jgi:hypothetical protein
LPSPGYNLLSALEYPEEGDLDLPINDCGDFNLDLFKYCYIEMEKQLDGHSELIGAEEEDILYGVHTSNSQSVHDVLMNLKESVEQSQSDTETEDSDSEIYPWTTPLRQILTYMSGLMMKMKI